MTVIETETGDTLEAMMDRVNAEGIVQELQNRARHVWEYHERGAWKPCKEFISDFLEEQLMMGAEDCGINIDQTGEEKYEYNFPNMLQTRKILMKRTDHPNGGEWNTVKVRSIRRIIVVAEPELPRG